MVFACRRNVTQTRQRSLAIEQPVRDEQGGQISWAHDAKIGNGAGAIARKILQGPWWRLQEEGGATAKGIWGDSAG
jgi:hypothetical protein